MTKHFRTGAALAGADDRIAREATPTAGAGTSRSAIPNPAAAGTSTSRSAIPNPAVAGAGTSRGAIPNPATAGASTSRGATASPAAASSGATRRTAPTPTDAGPVLSVRHLEKVYGSLGLRGKTARGAGAITRALADVSFDVVAGELVSIMGASGSGKSTLLNCVSTIDAPTSGQVLVEGTDATRLRGRALTRFRRERLGFIFQDSNLLDTLTARENIALPLTIAHVPADEVLGRVEEMAARLGIREMLDKYPYQLSGGQQQRVAASRALVTNPALVMADEPTGALDSKNARLLLEQLEELNRQRQSTILMVTHDGFAASYTHRVLFIRDGKIFTELRRGDASRREFFDRIMEVVAMIGGDGNDAL